MLEVLMYSLLRGAIAVAAVWLLVKAFKKARPSIQKHLWWLACLVFLASMLSYWGLAIPIKLPAEYAEAVLRAAPGANPTGDSMRVAQTQPTSELNFLSILLWAWALGTAVQLYRLTIESYKLKRAIREGRSLHGTELAGELHELSIEMGLSLPPRLIENTVSSSPYVAGLFKPTVVVPKGFAENFSPVERRLTFAHELAHLKSRDVWLGLVPTAVRILFWFFPPALWAANAWETGRETAADATALEVIGSEPSAYKRLLLRIVVQNNPEPALQAIGATASFHTLKARLSQLGNPDRRLHEAWLLIPAAIMIPWQITPIGPGQKTTLKNASFEQGNEVVSSWQTGQRISGVRYVWDHSTAHTGSSSIAIFKTADRYFPIAEWSQTIPYDGKAKKIGVWAWVKTDKSFKTVLDVQFLTPEGVESHAWVAYIGAEEDGNPPVTQNWKRVGGVVEIPPGTTEIAIAPQVYGPGKAWFDDIEARFVSGAPTQ